MAVFTATLYLLSLRQRCQMSPPAQINISNQSEAPDTQWKTQTPVSQGKWAGPQHARMDLFPDQSWTQEQEHAVPSGSRGCYIHICHDLCLIFFLGACFLTLFTTWCAVIVCTATTAQARAHYCALTEANLNISGEILSLCFETHKVLNDR